MPVRQPWLLKPPRTWTERFGREFFQSIPTVPGVYFLCGRGEGVLYVGKARNLRRRLSSYRSADPERAGRRIFRLVQAVERILWDVCPDEDAALARETALIRALRPRFNRAKVGPPVRSRLSLEREGRWLEFRITNEPGSEEGYGPFRQALGLWVPALWRRLWCAVHAPDSPHAFPSPLVQPRLARQFSVQLPAAEADDLVGHVQGFLAGTPNELLGRLQRRTTSAGRFLEALATRDFSRLEAFQEAGVSPEA